MRGVKRLKSLSPGQSVLPKISLTEYVNDLITILRYMIGINIFNHNDSVVELNKNITIKRMQLILVEPDLVILQLIKQKKGIDLKENTSRPNISGT